MSLIAFRPVATVSATEQGREGAIASVQFAPTPATSARLASHRILFRAHPGGFQLAAQHNLETDGEPMVPIAQPLALLFAMRSSDGDFLSRYSDDDAAAVAPSIFLTNRNAAGEPQAGPALSRDVSVGAQDRARIVPRRHRARFDFEDGARPDKVEVRLHFGGAMVGAPLAIETSAGAQAADVTVDLGDRTELAFRLKPKPQGTDQLIIADDELAELKPLGALELVLKPFPGPAPVGGRAFTAVFAR